MSDPIRPLIGHGGEHHTVWLLYSTATGGIHQAFLVAPDPSQVVAPPGSRLRQFTVGHDVLANLGGFRVRGNRVVPRGAAAATGTIR